MFLLTLLTFTSIQNAVQGQTILPVYVQSNSPVTLTCPTDDQTTTLTWTGPGGTLYVTGTTVETGLSGVVKPRISTRHTGGSYTLTFTEFLSSDTGIYTCTVDGTVDIQMVTVQGVTSASPVYTRQGGTVTLQCPDTGGSSSWSVTSISVIYTIGTDINPAIPGDTETRLSVTRQDGTYNLQISDVQLSDVREYKCDIGSTDTLYHLLLSIKPEQPSISDQMIQTEGNTFQMVCVSTGSRPAADIEWNFGGTWLSNNPTEVKVMDSATDTYTVTSTLYLTVSRQDNRKIIFCRARNRDLSQGIDSVRRSMTVLFGPDSAIITGNIVFVADGTNTLTLTCTTQEYNRHVHITWYNGTTRIPNTAGVTNTSGTYGGAVSTQVLRLTPDRYHDGNVIRCVVQNEDMILGKRTVSVILGIHC